MNIVGHGDGGDVPTALTGAVRCIYLYMIKHYRCGLFTMLKSVSTWSHFTLARKEMLTEVEIDGLRMTVFMRDIRDAVMAV